MNHNPMYVNVMRGDFIESTHLIDIVVADPSGAIVEAYGNAKEFIFPRSAIKSLQAIPLIESGAAEFFDLRDEHLALACSSHNAEPAHINGAKEILEKSGSSETCLECGAQLPKRPEDQADLVRRGIEYSAIHNNCSGKHAGFIAFAKYAGMDLEGYIGINHPVQKEIASVLNDITGTPHTAENHGIDGCSIPTYRIPINTLATAYAKFGVGESSSANRSNAMIRLRDACMLHPFMVAGSDRACTKLMEALPGRVFVKVGAEGVYTASVPEKGLGFAMKARDGNFRAVEVALASLLEKHLELNDNEREAMKPLANPVLKNWNALEVGNLRATV